MFFFEMTVLQFWRFLDPMLTYFCSSESNRVCFDYTLLSSQVLRCDMRRWGSTKKTQIAIQPTWTLQVCRWNPHFCQDLGVEIWVGVTRHSQAIHPDLLDLFRLKGLQCTIDEHHDWRALLSWWMMFGHPAACLVSASRKLFGRGYKKWALKWSHHVSFEWNMNWIFLIWIL